MTFHIIFVFGLICTSVAVLDQKHNKYSIQSSQEDGPSTTHKLTEEEGTDVRGIENIHAFLDRCLEGNVLEYTLKPLTKPGDNYNSVLQSLDVKISKNNDTTIETVHLVCKRTSEGVVSASQSKQFLNEMHFYSEIVPTIRKFEETCNIPNFERIDAFVQYFGSRLSLDSDAKSADNDAVTLLENIKIQNYTSLDRRGKFNRDEILAILKRLAKLHALIIAIRRLQPDVFNAKIDPYLHTQYHDSYLETLINITNKFANNLPNAFPNMTTQMQNIIKNQLNLCKEYLLASRTTPPKDTPYTTIHHRDLWTKNIMIKKSDTSENTIQVKILDFQPYDYESFSIDLTFFILYNAEIEEMNFKAFIEYYHREFVKTMTLVNCPLDDYTYEKMWHEIKEKTKLNLLKLYLYLAFDQIEMLKSDEIPARNNDFYLEQPPPEAIFNRWKCINDVFFANDLFG